MTDAPRIRFRDHVRVTWLLVVTLLGLVPIVLWILFSWVLRPIVRGVMRRRLAGVAGALGEPPEPDPAAWEGRTVFVVAGEASGDRLAARVVRAMKAKCPGLRVRGYAGPATAAAGAELDRDVVEHAVVGVIPVVRSLAYWWNLCAETLARLREDPPDLFFTVDFPGLNGRLAGWAQRAGVPTVHLVAPAVWAYAPWRLLRWRRALDHLLTIFPFEAVLFQESGIPSTFVGHPLFEAPLDPPRTQPAWPGGGPATVDLLPGSRRGEIADQARVVLEAARGIEAELPSVEFVVRLAEARDRERFEAASAAIERPRRLRVVAGEEESEDALPLLGAVASSGTVTAELGAACVPMAAFYRLSFWGRVGGLLGLTSPWFTLANLIAGRSVVPERLMVGSHGRRVAADFLSFAADAEAWARTRDELERLVRQRLAAPNVADRAARAVLATRRR